MLRRALIGAFVGGFIGFLLRPSIPLIGQLPFETVISRGHNLQGMDVMLQTTAEESFNYMVAGAVIGAIILVVVLGAARASVPQRPSPPPFAPPLQQPPVRPGFCTQCGNAVAPNAIFCQTCGMRCQVS